MDFKILCETLTEWKKRIADIDEFKNEKGNYYYNVRRVIDHFRELSVFLRKNEPAFRSWMMEYLEKHRREIFVKWWSGHVSEWAKDQVNRYPRKQLHPNTQAEWDRIFGTENAICFSLAYTVAKEAHEDCDIEHCDDKTILAIHKDKQHEDNDFFCYLCEDQENLWTSELTRRLENSAHPLLNTKRAWYLQFSHRWTDKIELGNWSPPKLFGTVYKDRGNSQDCYDFEEYKQYMITAFQERKGTTPIQVTKYFLDRAHWHGWTIPYWCDFKNEYNAFLLLWNCIDQIEPTIEVGLPILQEIEEMF